MEKQPTDQQYLFFNNDGSTPNSNYPLTIYREAFHKDGDEGADWLEKKFAANNWTNSWRWGVYPFHHFHSNSHEVLGVFSGTAMLQFGGAQGEEQPVKAGDIIIIPAGVGHKCLSNSDDFKVVGAYPDGAEPDLIKSEVVGKEQEKIVKNIAAVSFPASDPLFGKEKGIVVKWKYESINPVFSQLAEKK